MTPRYRHAPTRLVRWIRPGWVAYAGCLIGLCLWGGAVGLGLRLPLYTIVVIPVVFLAVALLLVALIPSRHFERRTVEGEADGERTDTDDATTATMTLPIVDDEDQQHS
ncbi:hypothetical protein H8R18_02235 [Nanchangia anserum]|uniref:Uncharacterized protein n=1 Tax=Nanchangia anserum TaxID=2692125 RepID=A0A8I0KQH9_9ACTO|nr:hypothetical protein [Nanchangia anserum]MBD3690005.1 hypothetical protein [Nanchangia anserum]QOX82194.1 hypothetical protein H8R18_02235 [Nanchangia anserum]